MDETMKYFIADLHLDHESAIAYNKRPFRDVGHMQDIFIDLVNQLPKGSILYLVGDTLNSSNKQKARELLDKFPKHVHYVFILGNHDFRLASVYKEYGRVEMLLEIKHKGRKFVLCHYPMYEWSSGHHGAIMIHGHTHGRGSFPGIILDVGWDVVRKPISAEEVVILLKDVPIYQPVHSRNNGQFVET